MKFILYVVLLILVFLGEFVVAWAGDSVGLPAPLTIALMATTFFLLYRFVLPKDMFRIGISDALRPNAVAIQHAPSPGGIRGGCKRFCEVIAHARWGLSEWFYLLLLVAIVAYGIYSLGAEVLRFWLPLLLLIGVLGSVAVKLGGLPLQFAVGLMLVRLGGKPTPKEYALGVVLRECLLRAGFKPSYRDGMASIVETDRYVPYNDKRDGIEIVIARKGISRYEYSSDPRERGYRVERFNTLVEFLRDCIDTRIDNAHDVMVAMSPAMSSLREGRVDEYLETSKTIETELRLRVDNEYGKFLNDRLFRMANWVLAK